MKIRWLEKGKQDSYYKKQGNEVTAKVIQLGCRIWGMEEGGGVGGSKVTHGIIVSYPY